MPLHFSKLQVVDFGIIDLGKYAKPTSLDTFKLYIIILIEGINQPTKSNTKSNTIPAVEK